MVRGEGVDVGTVAEDVLDEALERPLRADLDEDARAGLVERLEPLHELDGRGDLPARGGRSTFGRDVAVRRVEVARDVRDDRELRPLDPEPLEDRPEGDGRRAPRSSCGRRG